MCSRLYYFLKKYNAFFKRKFKIWNSYSTNHVLITLAELTKKHWLREKCPYSEFFLVRIFFAFGLITETYSVRMWENTDQRNSEYGHFSRSDLKNSYLVCSMSNKLLLNDAKTEVIILYLYVSNFPMILILELITISLKSSNSSNT